LTSLGDPQDLEDGLQISEERLQIEDKKQRCKGVSLPHGEEDKE